MSTLGFDSDDKHAGLHEPVIASGSSGEDPASSPSSLKWSSFRMNPRSKPRNSTTTTDDSLVLAEEGGGGGGDYSMMRTQHGGIENSTTMTANATTESVRSSSSSSVPRHNILFSSAPPRKKKPNIFHFHPLVTLEEKYGGDEYFVKRSRKPFLQLYQALNQPIQMKKKTTATVAAAATTTTATRDRTYTGGDGVVDEEVQVSDGAQHLSASNKSSSLANLFAGIYQSSLTYYHDGKLQIRLPKDDVRLIMDPFIPPGILSVERNASSSSGGITCMNKASTASSSSSSLSHLKEGDEESTTATEAIADYVDEEQGDTSRLLHHNRSSDLNYVLTVDPNLYKHVLEEISDSQWPCGIYWCCREPGEDKDQSVSINIAIGILFVVFSVFFLFAFILQDKYAWIRPDK